MPGYPFHCYPIVKYYPRNIPTQRLRDEYNGMNREELLRNFRIPEEELMERIGVEMKLIEKHRDDGHCLFCSQNAAWDQRAREVLYTMDLTGCSLGFVLSDSIDNRPHWRRRPF